MLENLPLQVFLQATFRKFHSPGKSSCLLILYNPCFSHDLNYYPCNLSCLCLTCLPSVGSSVECRMGLALSRSLLLSPLQTAINLISASLCLCFTVCSVWIWWKSPLAHWDYRTALPEVLRDPHWIFPVSTILSVYPEAQEHSRCSECLRDGLFLYLKIEWKKGQKLGKILL